MMRINHNLYNKICKSKRFILILIVVLVFGFGAKSVFAETSSSELYVPLIGITSVPDPLVLPNGEGNVTYHYAVKNFLAQLALNNVQVTDNNCSPITFIEGDDNHDNKLDYTETWRYTCNIKISETIQSIATATGVINNITATDSAYATVIVGSNNPAPLVSIVNITNIAYPLPLPAGGGDITFTYKVNNPGAVPLNNVTVTDDKCGVISGKLGDINGNSLLDIDEVWIYMCTVNLMQTTTSAVTVKAFANGLEAVDNATFTVTVQTPVAGTLPTLFDVGISPSLGKNQDVKNIIWAILAGNLTILIIFLFLIRKRKI